MNIRIAREVAARVWCDPEMSHLEMDCDAAEEIAQILIRLTPLALDAAGGGNDEIRNEPPRK